MKTVAISGMGGFIGSNLSKRLKDERYKIVRIIRGEPDFLRELFERERPEIIIHLSAYGNHYHQKDERLAFITNVKYLFETLDIIKDKKFKAFINFSTSSVTLPVQTMYSITKKMGEELCSYYAQKYSKPIISVRPYSLFGPREADFRFIPTLINNAVQNKKSKIAPEPRHDWIFVEDLVDALLLVIHNIDKVKEPVSIGTGRSWSNKEVADILDEIVKPRRIIYDKIGDMRSYDTFDWVADTSFLKSLGWQRGHSLREGLIETYKYYKKRSEK